MFTYVVSLRPIMEPYRTQTFLTMNTSLALRPTAELQAVLQADLEQAADFARASRADATRKAYGSDWTHFAGYCEGRGVEALPAEPAVLAGYLSHFAATLKPSTLQRRLSAISVQHKAAGFVSPTGHPIVENVWQGIRRTIGTRQEGKAALRSSQVRAMADALPVSLIGQRDKAVLLLGFVGAFRRSELVGLNVEDLTPTEGGLAVTVRRSKTDQTGEGTAKAIPYGANPDACPVTALQDWLTAAGITSGPVFRSVRKGGQIGGRLSDKAVARIVKAAAEAIGADPDTVAGHSLRSGFATSAALNGATDRAIMKQTGHRSRTMVDRYVRVASIWQDNAASLIGL